MVCWHRNSVGSRFVLIAVLIAGLQGIVPMRAGAEASVGPAFQGEDCYPNSGWMWTPGSFEPDIASQVQQELAQDGIDAVIEARSYGETDSCGTYSQHGIDFTITLAETASNDLLAQETQIDNILPVLEEFGKPSLGNVTLISAQGEVIPVNVHEELPNLQTLDATPPAEDIITKQVYVIVYDPLLSNGKKLSEYMHWNDHAAITQQTIDLFSRATNGRMNFVVADTSVVTSSWPELIDGFKYTEQSYLAVWSNPGLHHNPTDVNYNKILNSPEFDICGKVNRGEIDEVWIYNGPWFGFYESRLAGPGAYRYNSPPLVSGTTCSRMIPIMGPSVERTVFEATHNFMHRTEATMEKVYGSWAENRTNHSWDRFGLVKLQSPNYAYSGCGSAHWAPNAVAAEYDYSNLSGTLSNCGDFLNYPSLGDPLPVSQLVTCSDWGCNGIGYNEYWFNHFPSSSGCGSDNIANDWWIYLADPANALAPSSFCPSDVHWISGNIGVAGVTLSYIDDIPKTIMTDSLGNYSLVVSHNWSGTITPSKTDHTFLPTSRSYTDVAGNRMDQDYTTQGGDPTAYYVNISTGNNNNSCTSIAAPCRNIQETINKASSGNTIYVADGRYLFSTNPSPNVVIINKDIRLSGGWNSDFSLQNGASTIDGANTNNGILILSGTVILENFIIQNSVSWNSGAIYIGNGNVTLKRSTLRNNTASSNGAGIFVDNGILNIINSTVSGNRANSQGGGVYASYNSGAVVNIQNSTIAYNQASRGGGISQTNGTYSLTNTIIANNSSSLSAPDCEGTIAAANFNIIEDMLGCSITSGGNNLNLDPRIDVNLTGDMLMHIPSPDSSAIDAGQDTTCADTDQRGVARPQGAHCDIGAFELVNTTHLLTVTRTGIGNGTVTSLPGGIDCGLDCTESYSSDTTLILSAVQDDGSTFTGWSGGGCSGTGTCVVTVATATTVTATFDTQNYTLTVNKTGAGSGTVTSNSAGVNCGLDCSEAYAYNTSVTLTVIPDPDSVFTGWSGNLTGATNPASLTIDNNKTVTATFSLADRPPTDISFSNANIYENQATGTLVDTFSTTDPDVGDSFTYSFCGGSGDNSFRISGNNLQSAVVFDYETSSSYSICVRTTDKGRLSTTKIFTILITDIDEVAPGVSSMIRSDTDPTDAAIVTFTVNFSEPVTGVNASDFTLSTTGTITSAAINNVIGSDNSYTVSVNTGVGNGALRLEVPITATITDLVGNVLGSLPFISEDFYTIQKQAATPLKPMLLLPPSNNYVTSISTPTFIWNNVAHAARYEIQFAANSAFTQSLASRSVTDPTFAFNTRLADGKYYWRVQAYNIANQPGGWSASRYFTVDTTTPAPPVLRLPLNNASTRGVPTFRWSVASGAVRYEFQTDNDADFSSPVYSVIQRLTYRRPPGVLRGTYFWHVRAQDAAGNWSGWSEASTVNILPPR